MRRPSLILLCLTGVSLAGCYADPFQNPGDWALTSAPRENLAAQVADPSELLQGHGDVKANGVAAAAGVDEAIGGAAGTAAGLQKAQPPITFTSGTGS